MILPNGDVVLDYGPVGDLNSSDMFEWAQARMPDEWHVEGQVIHCSLGGWYGPQQPIGWRAAATRHHHDGTQVVVALGYTKWLALANLVRSVVEADRPWEVNLA